MEGLCERVRCERVRRFLNGILERGERRCDGEMGMGG